MKTLLRFCVFTAGVLVMSYGVCLIIASDLGVMPWDVFHIGLAKHTPLTVGMAMQLTGVFLIAVTAFLTRRRPQIGTLLNMFLVGLFVDLFFFFQMVPELDGIILKYMELGFGILLFGFGAGMYISPGLGAGPRDGLNLALSLKTGGSLRLVKTALEIGALAVGYFLGGPVGIGTVITSLSIGFVFQSSVLFWRRIFQTYLNPSSVAEGSA